MEKLVFYTAKFSEILPFLDRLRNRKAKKVSCYLPEVHSGLLQTPKKKCFVTIVNGYRTAMLCLSEKFYCFFPTTQEDKEDVPLPQMFRSPEIYFKNMLIMLIMLIMSFQLVKGKKH